MEGGALAAPHRQTAQGRQSSFRIDVWQERNVPRSMCRSPTAAKFLVTGELRQGSLQHDVTTQRPPSKEVIFWRATDCFNLELTTLCLLVMI